MEMKPGERDTFLPVRPKGASGERRAYEFQMAGVSGGYAQGSPGRI